jgi:chromosome segregation ATPase
LDKNVNALQSKLNSTSKELTKVNRRIDTLKEHLYQSEFYKELRSLKRQYDRLYSQYTAAKKETGFWGGT